MNLRSRTDAALQAALASIRTPHTPPRLSAAMTHAVLPGGGRVRPLLTLAVAQACGDAHPAAADAAAVAVELLHCSSLVHDDLPCFDDAELRRGLPTVHAAFGEALAVLTGDALIVLAFEHLARACVSTPQLLPALTCTIATGVGAARGIVGGQAWESEPNPDLRRYHRAKTGALFEAAVCAGAIAGGGDPEAWRELGLKFGEAYQVADDLGDAFGDAALLGKPVGQDCMHSRPNAAAELGLDGALRRLGTLVDHMVAAVPACAGRAAVQEWLVELSLRLYPAQLRPHARAPGDASVRPLEPSRAHDVARTHEPAGLDRAVM
jgi:geranylgeranyl diphosphate synthase type II